MTWQEKDVLAIFAGLDARPGQWRPVKGLWLKWGTRGSNQDFGDALSGLVAQGLLSERGGGTDYALTEAGYAAISN